MVHRRSHGGPVFAAELYQLGSGYGEPMDAAMRLLTEMRLDAAS